MLKRYQMIYTFQHGSQAFVSCTDCHRPDLEFVDVQLHTFLYTYLHSLQYYTRMLLAFFSPARPLCALYIVLLSLSTVRSLRVNLHKASC